MNPPEYDDVLRMIEKIPKKWNDDGKISFKIITYREDATWIASKIFEEVDRNLISAKIEAESSEYSIELDVMLIVVGGLVAKKSIDMMLEELRDHLKKKWNAKRRKNKRKIR